MCGRAEFFHVTHAGTGEKKYFIGTKVFTTDALPRGFCLNPFYTAPVFISMFVAWQHTARLTDGRVFATVNQHTQSVTIKQQLQWYKYSNYRMLPGIRGRHSITFTSSFLYVCVCVCVCVCVRVYVCECVYRNALTVFSIIWNGCNLVKYYFTFL